MLEIGDIVKPSPKALKKSKLFTDDRKFIVTKAERSNFNEGYWWYELAAKGDKEANYALDEDELVLVKKFDWEA